MGFFSFHDKYYRDCLSAFENRTLSATEIYKVQQLLKMLDDLTDEGYTELNDYMESEFSCLTRLRMILKKAGVEPFGIEHDVHILPTYAKEEQELNAVCDSLLAEAEKPGEKYGSGILGELRKYCEWIGYEEDTAYVFLFRDALLPYLFFKSRGCNRIHPWLISRRFIEDIEKAKNVDDEIRLPIYEALEAGKVAEPEFSAFCAERILHVLDSHRPLKDALTALLASVAEKRIIVVESGYMGTIPMLLKALDSRVSFKMYTTAPYLYETYREEIFCRRYEDVRKLETVNAQELLTQYASFRNGRFYVNLCENEEIRKRALAEIRYVTDKA